jgi:hypothetical protein
MLLERRAALAQSGDDCPGCLSQTSLVIGIPTRLLSWMLINVSSRKYDEMVSFLAANFVFPVCGFCRASESEYAKITAAAIEKRYRRLLKALHGHERAPAGTEKTEQAMLILLVAAVRQRDAA